MKTYIYKFADGTTSAVEVTDELYAVLREEDEAERNKNRAETRRHTSIDELAELGVEPSYTDEYFAGELSESIEDPALREAVLSLTAPQKRLLTRLYMEKQTVTEIAEQEGVAVCSISKRLERIYKKIRNFMPDRQLLPVPVAICVGAETALAKIKEEAK